MSKLEELIKEFCPNGVIRVTIGKICKISRGIVMSKDFIRDNHGDYPVYSSQTENNGCLGYINTYKYDGEYVTWTTDGANAGTVFYRSGKFSITNVCGLLEVKDLMVVNTKYLYYALSIEARRYVNQGMGNPKLMSNIMASVQIPLPALPVQREIVRILDSFTLYSAELTAELTARRKQYEFYRDKLLMPKSSTYQTEWKELKDVCRLVTGATPSTSKKEYWENGTIPWMSSGEVNNKRIFYTEEKITELGYQSSSTTLVPIHSVVIALAGQGKTRGKVAITEIELCTNQSLCSLICGTSMNYKFLYYYLDGKYEELRAISNGDGTRGGLSLRLLAPYKIPVPPMEVQERIVKVLDNFDAICSDLGIGLPAEIEKRQKQYEYYRDKLLSVDINVDKVINTTGGATAN